VEFKKQNNKQKETKQSSKGEKKTKRETKSRNRLLIIENKLMVTRGEGDGGWVK